MLILVYIATCGLTPDLMKRCCYAAAGQSKAHSSHCLLQPVMQLAKRSGGLPHTYQTIAELHQIAQSDSTT